MSKSKEEMIATFQKLPAEEQWRFFIDGYRQSEGEGAFDVREPGYMAAMKAAFQVMLDSIEQPLTANLLIELHKHALTGVDDTDNEHLETFRNGDPGDFGLVTNTDMSNPKLGNVSLDGIVEFVNSNAFNETVTTRSGQVVPKFEIIVNHKDVSRTHTPEQIHDLIRDNGARFYCKHESSDSLERTVNLVLSTYNDEIYRATTSEDKLNAIITMVSELERRHLFTDGNARTLVMLVLNRELVKNGFTPTILENPNRFDLFSRDELKAEIAVGAQMFWHHASKAETEKLLKLEELSPRASIKKTLEIKEKLSNIEGSQGKEEDREHGFKF